MSDEARRALETTVAYLRLGVEDGGIRIGIKGGHALTPELRQIVARGDMAVMRGARTTGRRIDRVHTTPQGIDRLAGIDERYGETFGPASGIPKLRNDQPRR